jgi:hypothetical protein
MLTKFNFFTHITLNGEAVDGLENRKPEQMNFLTSVSLATNSTTKIVIKK